MQAFASVEERMMEPFMPIVRDYMTPSPHCIEAHEPVSKAGSMMREHGVRHLLVLTDGKLTGLVSERDLAWIHDGLPPIFSRPLTVEDAMTPQPYTTHAHAALNLVAREMAARRCGSAVVTEGSSVVGIFTTVDALEALADSLEGKHVRAGASAGVSRPIQQGRHVIRPTSAPVATRDVGA
jgi:acetoin utilization protein AcuB